MNKSLILVVEDDTSVRNLITTTLKAHEYRYLTAPDGQSAILEASSHNPDIVLLDLGLPDMDGVEIIKKIRTWSNMPIIVISARSEDTDKIDALDAGVVEVIFVEDIVDGFLSHGVERLLHETWQTEFELHQVRSP
jgi:two-component system KDP operon response regulator KdpE